MVTTAIGVFVVTAVIGLGRILAGPTLADRAAALDVTLISLMGAITVDAANRGDPTSLVVLGALAIIGFTTTVAVSRFIELRESSGLP
jgi:multicomponent Na+:H+ antiporter subunit F